MPYPANFRSTIFLGKPKHLDEVGVGLLQQVPEQLHQEPELKGKRTQKVTQYKWQDNLALQAV